MSSFARLRHLWSRPHLAVISLIGIIVPSRVRADWREEWQAELNAREQRAADWDRLGAAERWQLTRRSAAAFWDAIWLQRRRWEDDFVQDVRYALRVFVKQPTFSVVAIVTLALGIGANAAVFTFVNALVLRPLAGVSDPERLVLVGRQFQGRDHPSDSSYPDFLDYRERSATLDGVAVSTPRAFHFNAGGQTERVVGELVSSEYFDVLGVAAQRGRVLGTQDTSASAVLVLSHRFWLSRFAGREDVIGSTVRLDGHEFTIIGVAADRFEGIEVGAPRDVWVPLTALTRLDPDGAHFARRQASWLQMFGRLAPGVTLAGARAELSAIAERLSREHPQTNTRVGISVEPGLGRDVEIRRALRRYTRLPLLAVAIVLLVACANVAGLLLARGAARRRELATRLALGARRTRLVRQLLVESLVLGLAGGGLGLLVGMWLTEGVRRLLPDRYLFLSFDVDFGLDYDVFVFTFIVAVAASLFFGLVPALHTTRAELVPTLKDARGAAGHRTAGLRGVLVVGQLALSTVLLVAAGLCVRTLHNVAAIDIGYDAPRVLTARLDLGRQRYEPTRARREQWELLERLQAAPGVDAAGLSVTLPLNDGRWEDAIRREGDPTRFQTFQNVVTPGYFDAMGIPLVAGRRLSNQDDERAPQVAVVNQTLARLLWPGETPVGKQVTVGQASIEIVGVVQDIKGRNLVEAAGPLLYRPLWQHPHANVVLHVRSTGSAASLVPMLQREVRAVDADVPLYAIKTLDAHVSATLTPQRLLAYLISGFGVLAVLLAGIGLYGLLSYAVMQRSAELGIRVALGARQADVLRLVVGGGMRLTALGVATGAAAAGAITPMMAGLLFGVRALDPLTYGTVSAMLLVVALVACAGPAARAAHADPAQILRGD